MNFSKSFNEDTINEEATGSRVGVIILEPK